MLLKENVSSSLMALTLPDPNRTEAKGSQHEMSNDIKEGEPPSKKPRTEDSHENLPSKTGEALALVIGESKVFSLTTNLKTM